MIGHINHGMKHAGERSAGNPPAAFDVEGAGNVMQLDDSCIGAPVLDPTCVQQRLACLAGISPAGVEIRSPVAWIAVRRETE